MEIKQFRDNIRTVLNHLSDVAFLETNNLINLLLTDEEARQSNRVQLLRAKISESIQILNPPEDTPIKAAEWRSSRILTMRYLNGMELYRIEEELGLSQRQVQRELKKGVDALVSILWEQRQALEKTSANSDRVEENIPDTDYFETLQTELKSWEITFGLSNLSQMIEQAVHLCEFLSNSDLRERVHYDDVDKNLCVMVDHILTKQGLYKLLSMLVTGAQDSIIHMQQRRLNDHFIELAITIDHPRPLSHNDWQIAQLFFTIQGLNHSLKEQPNQTVIAINLPLMHQNRCLVIDDVASVRTLIERMLGSYGIQVFGAENPEEALKLAQLMVPNFILLDILMPKIDGWQLMKNFKANPETSKIPVFICSALYEPELARAVGAAGYIRKPINRLDLIQTLQQANLINP